jgi:hypothetical protein
MSDPMLIVPKDDAELVQRFESLGDNCEFGLLQRYAGAEPHSLFRFNFTGLAELLAGLENRFADLAAPGNVKLTWTDEWMVSETRYRFSYHTFNKDKSYSEARLEQEQTRWLRYMAEKFIEELETGERIYVRKGEGPEQLAAIRTLHMRLRQFAPVTLLWVAEADADHPVGTVEKLGNGLIRGWVSKFADYLQAPDFEPMEWIRLLRRVWALRYLNDADAYPPVDRVNLAPRDFGGWAGSAVATAEFSWEVPKPADDAQVMKHVFVTNMAQDDNIFSWFLSAGLSAGALFVASVDIWLPDDFTGTIDLVFLGRSSVRNSNPKYEKRGGWQKIWVSARLEDVNRVVVVRLNGKGPAGSKLYTANWRVELGGIP